MAVNFTVVKKKTQGRETSVERKWWDHFRAYWIWDPYEISKKSCPGDSRKCRSIAYPASCSRNILSSFFVLTEANFDVPIKAPSLLGTLASLPRLSVFGHETQLWPISSKQTSLGGRSREAIVLLITMERPTWHSSATIVLLPSSCLSRVVILRQDAAILWLWKLKVLH